MALHELLGYFAVSTISPSSILKHLFIVWCHSIQTIHALFIIFATKFYVLWQYLIANSIILLPLNHNDFKQDRLSFMIFIRFYEFALFAFIAFFSYQASQLNQGLWLTGLCINCPCPFNSLTSDQYFSIVKSLHPYFY